MLEATELWKSYGENVAVAGVSFAAKRGEILGLLGPNGAGKSTTVSMLCGLFRPDRGTVTLDGEPVGDDANAVKRRIGLVTQEISLHEELPAIANLRLFGALYGVEGELIGKRCAEVLDLVGLTGRAKAKPSTFSGGMKRRLNIACALVHDPDVLILDEPTVGIDPQSRNAIFDNLELLRSRGKTLVYTTHYMEEVERLCDRIVIIDHGNVIASDTREGLQQLLPSTDSGRIEIEGDVNEEVLAWLVARGLTVRGGTHAKSLEAVFLHLTGRQLRD